MQASDSARNIAAIGGGIVGLSCAVALARAGHRVTVFDESQARVAPSWGNAGHIAIEQAAPLASIASLRSVPRRLFAFGGPIDLPWRMAPSWAPFAARLVAASSTRRFESGCNALGGLLAEAMPAWKRLVAALDDQDLLRVDGHFVVWEDPATAAAGRAAWTRAAIGTTGIDAALSSGDWEGLRAIGGARVVDAIRFRETGQITDLSRLADALEKTLRAHGGRVQRQRASVEVHGGRASVPGCHADLVVLCAGVRSHVLAAAAGHGVPLVAERGYHLRAAPNAWPLDLPPVVFEDRSIIVTRFSNCVQVAGFMEFGDPDSPPDPRKWRRLERHVAELGLPIKPPFETWMGARPTLPDYLPAIGRSTRAGNLIYAFGHQHLGLTLAPVTAEIIQALVDATAPRFDLAPFDLARFE